MGAFVIWIAMMLTTWLWVPWVIGGTQWIYRKNMATVNDLSRPEIVTPPSDIVRPSKAEKETK